MPESVRRDKLFIGAPVEVAEDTTLPSSMRHMSAITEKFHATRELAMHKSKMLPMTYVKHWQLHWQQQTKQLQQRELR